MPTSRRIFLLVAFAVLALAFALDRTVAAALHGSWLAVNLKGSVAATILKLPGEFWVTAVAAAVAYFTHSSRWRASVLLLLAGIASGVNGLVKWCAGRLRPYTDPSAPGSLVPYNFHPFINGVSGMTTKNLCFPSGHAALAFATAAMLAELFPRWRWVFYTIASATAAERVAENAHYLSDSVAAAILGIVCAKVIYCIAAPRLLKTPRGFDILIKTGTSIDRI